MKKVNVVKKALDFDNIIKSGKKKRNKYFNIFYQNYGVGESLFGIAVSKKLGNAVFRNKCKRQIRAMIDDNRDIFKLNNKYIIMLKSEGTKLSYHEKEKELIKLLKGEK